MANVVRGCSFCSIIHGQRDKHLKASDNAVIIQDRSPRAQHHYLILSKLHISHANNLTVVDLPLVKEMDTLGRDYLREILKEKGEADTVEDLLRMGFHWSFFLGVRHLHMHLLYPTRGMSFFSRTIVFRSGRIFRTTKDIIDKLEKKKDADSRKSLKKSARSSRTASGSSKKNTT